MSTEQKFDFLWTVTLVVSGIECDEAEFVVHRQRLIETSTFFAEHPDLNDDQSGAQINLTEFDPRFFAIFVEWAYSGKILHRMGITRDDGQQIAADLVGSYVIAHQLGAKEMKNHVMDCFRTVQKTAQYTFTSEVCKPAFEQTPIGSKLRAFIIDHWVTQSKESIFDTTNNGQLTGETPLITPMEIVRHFDDRTRDFTGYDTYQVTVISPFERSAQHYHE